MQADQSNCAKTVCSGERVRTTMTTDGGLHCNSIQKVYGLGEQSEILQQVAERALGRIESPTLLEIHVQSQKAMYRFRSRHVCAIHCSLTYSWTVFLGAR